MEKFRLPSKGLVNAEWVRLKIVKWRRDTGWSLSTLSQVLRNFRGLGIVSEGMLRRWERRTHQPQRRHLKALIAAERYVDRRVALSAEARRRMGKKAIAFVKQHPETFKEDCR